MSLGKPGFKAERASYTSSGAAKSYKPLPNTQLVQTVKVSGEDIGEIAHVSITGALPIIPRCVLGKELSTSCEIPKRRRKGLTRCCCRE